MDEDLTEAQREDRAAHNAAVARLKSEKEAKLPLPPLFKHAVTQTPGEPSMPTRRSDDEKRAIVKRVQTMLRNPNETIATACESCDVPQASYYCWKRKFNTDETFEPITKIEAPAKPTATRETIGDFIDEMANRIAAEKIGAFLAKLQNLINEYK